MQGIREKGKQREEGREESKKGKGEGSREKRRSENKKGKGYMRGGRRENMRR